MPWTWVLSLFAMGMAIVSVSSSGNTQIVRLSETDSGGTVTVAPGAVVEIVLATNPATGYSWQPTAMEPSILKYLGSVFAGERATLGGGGRATLRFQALAPGQSELELRYYRHPFEPVTEAVERFLVNVIVTP